ncbi:hypothetical protein CYMTET_12604 [Cymbomonas tetramitiformis]|uniref:Reverse transcriptase domain-containing protein n=1 Tax=Cymbomonas tetramitiformis TaxID=36881 RepID=A0AAE0GJP4_9CHLO|nr:hypothetical protein CYMTET_12604 [Cymbomonas tetramitiformis]
MGARLVALISLSLEVGCTRLPASGEVLGRLTGMVVGVGVQGGAEVCVHTVRALLGVFPSCSDGYAQQGDPLGPFFMAAPLHPVLGEVLRAHPEVYIIAYLDDIHILGELGQLRMAHNTAVSLLAGIGLELNVGKSAVFARREVAGSPYPLGEEAVALSQLAADPLGGAGLKYHNLRS